MAFTDDFTGTENDALSSRSGWSGTAGAEINASNQLRRDGDGGSNNYNKCTDQGDADHYTQANVYASGTNINQGFPVAIRLTDGSNFIAVRVYADTYSLEKRDAGSFTLLDSVSAAGFTTGDMFYLEGEGNSISFENQNDGASALSATETFNNTETGQGLNPRRPQGASEDPWLNNFEAGALAAGGAINERSLSSNVSIVDSTESFRELVRLLTASLNLSDALTITSTTQALVDRALSDVLSVSDITYVYREYTKGLQDNPAITDSLASYREFYKGLNDTTEIYDSLIALLQGRVLEANLTDSLLPTDSLLQDKQFFKSLLETAIVTDELIKQSLLFKLLVGSINISDAVIAELIQQLRIRNLSDTLDITDSVAIELIQLLAQWGIIKIDLARELIDTAISAEAIKIDVAAENIITSIEQAGD